MSHSLTESSAFTTPVTVPDDGDVRNAASVNGAFQALANRTAYLQNHALPNGAMVGGDRARVPGQDNTLRVGRIAALVLGDVVYANSAEASVALSGLVADTHYYVYAYISGGAIAFEQSTTAPDADLRFKTGDTSRRYVCAFVAKTFPAVGVRALPFTMRGGRYTFRFSAEPTSNVLGALAAVGGTAGAWVTTTGPGLWAPPHARALNLRVDVINTGTSEAVDTVQLRPTGDTPALVVLYPNGAAGATGGSNLYNTHYVEMPPGLSGGAAAIDVYKTASGANVTHGLAMLGWSE